MGEAWETFLKLQNHPTIQRGAIASGDEDILTAERRLEVQKYTTARAVAWEGAGAARACAFLKIPFCEIRAITDDSSTDLKQDFTKNLNLAMLNLANWLMLVCSP